MRTLIVFALAVALAGVAAAEVRSSSSYAIQRETLSGGGGTYSGTGMNVFASFAQSQTGIVQSAAGGTARLGFLSSGRATPSPPQNLTAIPGERRVSLDWNDNGEPDLAGYNVYRSVAQGGPYARVNGATAAESGYSDTGLTNGTTYYYVVRAVGDDLRESADSNEAWAKPLGAGVLGGGCGAGAAALFALAVLLGRKRW